MTNKYQTIVSDACAAIKESKRRIEKKGEGTVGGASALIDLLRKLMDDDGEETPPQDETPNS